MNDSLSRESEQLARSWMRHEADVLRDYLVAGVEDPRINLQSVFSRHFLVRVVCGERFAELMEHEYRFSAAMNWLLGLVEREPDPSVLENLLYGLRQRSDNVEGLEVPHFLSRILHELPATVGGITLPNYLAQFLAAPTAGRALVLDTFVRLWHGVLGELPLGTRPRVLEPACGSANDYRLMRTCGLTRLVDYTGFDLCEKNVSNARTLFPDAQFSVGNVFEVAAADQSFDYCFVHDLFEHLSLEGLEQAIAEICRVTRRALCLHFFNMGELPRHSVRPTEDYHWNQLSAGVILDTFAAHGFVGPAVNLGLFLRERVRCPQTHNPNAYTLWLERR